MRQGSAGSVLRWLWLGSVAAVVTFPVYVTVVTALLPQNDVAAGHLVPSLTRLARACYQLPTDSRESAPAVSPPPRAARPAARCGTDSAEVRRRL